MRTAAQRFRAPQYRSPEELDAALDAIVKSSSAPTLAQIRKAGEAEGGLVHGAIVLIASHPALVGFTPTDVLRVADRLIKYRNTEESAAAQKTASDFSARRFRELVQSHLHALEEIATGLQDDVQKAHERQQHAAKRVAEHDVKAHRDALRSAIEDEAIAQAKAAAAKQKAQAFAASMKARKADFARLVELCGKASFGAFQRQTEARLQLFESNMRTCLQIAFDLYREISASQNAASEAAELAEELGIPRSHMMPLRRAAIDAGTVRGELNRAGARALKAVGRTTWQLKDLINLDWWA